MKTILFPIIFLIVFLLLNLYIIKRFVNKLHIKNIYKLYIKIFLYINFIGIIGYMYARYNPNIPNIFYFLFSLPIGIIFIIFCTAIIYDIKYFIIKKTPISNKRRDFLKKGLDYLAFASVVGFSARGIYEARTIELETVDIRLRKLKKPYSIVQLSDIHIGGIIDKEFVKDMVNKVNSLKPDLVVITGDLVDIGLKYAVPALEELTKLESKYGTYFIVGNHEYHHGLNEIISTVNSLGIKTLENENLYIGEEKEGFNLAGVYDYFGYRIGKYQPDLSQALKDIKEDDPTILLAHQPVFINEVKSNVDLVLSGHTHGGQIYPFRVLVKLVQPYIAGLYQHNKTTQIYVNKGTGFWGPPMRLGASSEITLINLKNKV